MGDEEREELLRRLFDKGDELATPTTTKKKQDHIDWASVSSKAGFKSEKELFNELYLSRELSVRDIASIIDIPPSTVRFRIKKLKIPMRPKGGPNNVRGLRKVENALAMLGEDFETLISKYGGSDRSIAKALNVSINTIMKYKAMKAEADAKTSM